MKEWKEYIRPVIPFQIIHVFIRGIVKYSKEVSGFNMNHVRWYRKKDFSVWEWPVKKLEETLKFHLTLMRDYEARKKHFMLIKELTDNVRKKTSIALSSKLSEMDDKELLQLYNELVDAEEMQTAITGHTIDAIDAMVEQKITVLLDKEKVVEDYKKLSAPQSASFVTEEEIMLGKSSLDELKEKFWWTSLGWNNTTVKDDDYFKEKMPSHTNIQEELAANRQQMEETLRRYNNPELDFLTKLMHDYLPFHDYRKECQMKTLFCLRKMFDEISKRHSISKELLLLCSVDEIKKILKGDTINLEEIGLRKDFCYYEGDQDKIILLSGKEAREKIESIASGMSKKRKFKGMTANPGKVSGRALVGYDSSEINKNMEEGFILVTSMTTPDFVPAMKKAAAIVTDEGGVTCHAAIISREFGIPCVVSTNDASRIIKNDEMVEVDADKGIVRIIK